MAQSPKVNECQFREVSTVSFARELAGLELSSQGARGLQELDGCPTFASAYVGRKRRAKPSIAFC
jgi:hypothetical protein